MFADVARLAICSDHASFACPLTRIVLLQLAGRVAGMRALLQQKCRPLALVQVMCLCVWRRGRGGGGCMMEEDRATPHQPKHEDARLTDSHRTHVAGKGTMAVDGHRGRRSDDGISNFLLVHVLVLVLNQPSHNDPRLHLGPGHRGAARPLPHPKKWHYGCLRRAVATGVAQGKQQRRASEAAA